MCITTFTENKLNFPVFIHLGRIESIYKVESDRYYVKMRTGDAFELNELTALKLIAEWRAHEE